MSDFFFLELKSGGQELYISILFTLLVTLSEEWLLLTVGKEAGWLKTCQHRDVYTFMFLCPGFLQHGDCRRRLDSHTTPRRWEPRFPKELERIQNGKMETLFYHYS